jgi:hypothetical protein
MYASLLVPLTNAVVALANVCKEQGRVAANKSKLLKYGIYIWLLKNLCPVWLLKKLCCFIYILK